MEGDFRLPAPSKPKQDLEGICLLVGAQQRLRGELAYLRLLCGLCLNCYARTALDQLAEDSLDAVADSAQQAAALQPRLREAKRKGASTSPSPRRTSACTRGHVLRVLHQDRNDTRVGEIGRPRAQALRNCFGMRGGHAA